MKMKLAKFCAASLLTIVATPVFAQSNTDNKTAAGSITIYQPLTLGKDADMVFGRVVRPSSGVGTVALAASATAQTVAGAGAVALDTATTNAAKFTATGEGGAVINVAIPPTFNMNGPGASIAVTTSTDLATPATTSLGGTAGTASSKVFYVGGSASIPTTQTGGAYSGSFTVTVTYN